MKKDFKYFKQAFIGIMSAFFNLIFRRRYIKKLAAKRKVICDSCINNSTVLKEKFPKTELNRIDEHCTLCDCNLFLKRHSTKTKCPSNLWDE